MTDIYAPVVVLRMPNWLGDAIMALPALDYVAREIPQAAIVVSCRPNLTDLFRSRPSVFGIIPSPKHGWGGLLQCTHPYRMIDPTEEPVSLGSNEISTERKTAMRTLPLPLARRFMKIDSGGSFDAGALFPNSLSSAIWLWRIGAVHRVGYNRNARGLFLTKRISATPSALARHLTEYYLTVAEEMVHALRPESVNWPSFSERVLGSLNRSPFFSAAELADLPRDPTVGIPIPLISIPARGEKEATSLMTEAGVVDTRDSKIVKNKMLVIAPMSAYGSVKDWPSHYYAELVKRYADAGWRAFVTGAESQWSVCEEIAAVSPNNVVNVAGRTTLAGLLALIKHADLFIGGDSGSAHAAAALGVRTVAIYGVTDPAHTRQLGRYVRIIGAHEERYRAALNHEILAQEASPRLERATKGSLHDPKVAVVAKALLEAISVERILEAAEELGRSPR